MIIFDQDSIVQPQTMSIAASKLDSLLSKNLRPGSVFLVHAILTLPRLSLFAIDTRSAVAVATPDMWVSKIQQGPLDAQQSTCGTAN